MRLFCPIAIDQSYFDNFVSYTHDSISFNINFKYIPDNYFHQE